MNRLRMLTHRKDWFIMSPEAFMYRIVNLYSGPFLLVTLLIPPCACDTSSYWLDVCVKRWTETRKHENKRYTNLSGFFNLWGKKIVFVLKFEVKMYECFPPMYISGWPDGLADRQESGVKPTASWKSVASYKWTDAACFSGREVHRRLN